LNNIGNMGNLNFPRKLRVSGPSGVEKCGENMEDIGRQENMWGKQRKHRKIDATVGKTYKIWEK
jgi:hypothetical protein